MRWAERGEDRGELFCWEVTEGRETEVRGIGEENDGETKGKTQSNRDRSRQNEETKEDRVEETVGRVIKRKRPSG